MKLKVDQPQRLAKMRAHTAAHLLHSQLQEVLGKAKQAGSFVDQDYLRLDFQAQDSLSDYQLKSIQDNINKIIYQAISVEKLETTLEKAKSMGATALFEDKYDKDSVRVIKIQDVSIELCGGTHVSNTSHIGAFKILAQESIASGIKRIIASTGPKVYKQAIKLENTLQNIAQKINAPINQVEQTLDKTIRDYQAKEKQLESIRASMLDDKLKSIDFYTQKPFDKVINLSKNDFFSKIDFKRISHKAKSIFQEGKILLFKETGHFAIISNSDWDANKYARSLNLRGGGPSNFVQGKDEKIVNKFNN